MKEKIIRQLHLFAALPQGEFEHLASALTEKAYPPDSLLIQEGDPGDHFCILIEGEVDVIKALGTVEERVLSTHGPGAFLGEMSLLDPMGVRSASVRASTTVRSLEMTRDDFEKLIKRHPSVAMKILRELNIRMRKSENDTIRDLREKNQELGEAYLELKAAQETIIEKEKLETELAMAHEIQQSFLPRCHAPVKDFDFGARMAPARAVGGDLYDFFTLEDGKVGIAIGDVSDKSVSAALFMALFSSLLRVEAKRAANPADAFQEINNHLLERNEAGMFVTAIYGVLDSNTGEYIFARAGHEVPILFDPKGQAHTPEHGLGQPLCIFPQPELDVGKIQIPPGHTLVMYSDGITDATNPENQRFGLERLVNSPHLKKSLSAQELCDQIIAEIQAFQELTPQFDDMTLVAIHRSG